MSKYKVEVAEYPLMQRFFDFCDSDNKQLAIAYAAKWSSKGLSVSVFEYWYEQGWKKI